MVWSMMGSSPPSSANLPKVLSFSARLVLSCMRFWSSDTITSGVEELVQASTIRAALYGLSATSVKMAAGCCVIP